MRSTGTEVKGCVWRSRTPARALLRLRLGVLACSAGIWLRLRSGRLAPCVLMHGLWNGLTFLNLVLLA